MWLLQNAKQGCSKESRPTKTFLCISPKKWRAAMPQFQLKRTLRQTFPQSPCQEKRPPTNCKACDCIPWWREIAISLTSANHDSSMLRKFSFWNCMFNLVTDNHLSFEKVYGKSTNKRAVPEQFIGVDTWVQIKFILVKDLNYLLSHHMKGH